MPRKLVLRLKRELEEMLANSSYTGFSTLEATFPFISIQRYDDTTDVMLALISTRAPWSTVANGIVCDALQESMTHR